MCTVLLPTGVNPIAVNKYIISYIKLVINISQFIMHGQKNIKLKDRSFGKTRKKAYKAAG